MSVSKSILVAGIIILGTWYFVFYDAKSTPSTGNVAKQQVNTAVNNSVIKDGIQYVTITAQGGYSPKQSLAVANIPTKLIVKTNGTYDCSAALAIPSIKYRNMLPSTGETVIDIGTKKIGDTLQGVCAMGMYSFAVQFK